MKSEENKKKSRASGFSFWLAVCGIFHCPGRISASVGDCGNSHHDCLWVIASRQSPSCVVLCAMHSLASKLALWATPFAKTPHRGVFAALTQRAMPVGINRGGIKHRAHLRNQRKKDTEWCPFCVVLYSQFRCHSKKVNKIKDF